MENGTKLRILYLYQQLIQHSDEDHPESTAELARMLEREFNIKTARNTISNDLTILVNSGLHIEVTRSTQNLYYYDGAPFELAELKVLIDDKVHYFQEERGTDQQDHVFDHQRECSEASPEYSGRWTC